MTAQSSKEKPKACGCAACKRGKGSEAGQCTRRQEERAFRHAAKIELAKQGVDAYVPIAPRGTYTD
jgi:hypothetical protein